MAQDLKNDIKRKHRGIKAVSVSTNFETPFKFTGGV